jgi:acetyl coenzyme A synthetase (ADP forming)-like protein
LPLQGFFDPTSVAVIGVGRKPGGVGRAVYDNLLAAGFAGDVYPVNPLADEIDGHRCYHSIGETPSVPDLVVIAVPADLCLGAISELGDAGVHAAIVISAGFKETGPAGAAMERALTAAAAERDVRLLGPNCLGLISTRAKLNASFSSTVPPTGGIAFMSQSGALGTAILDWAAGVGIGLSAFVSLGNKADLDESDLLEAWTDDEDTKVVVAYLESIADGRRFVDVASTLVAAKPLIVLKAGSSDAGARAVSSHTGSLAGSQTAYEAAFRKAGIIRAETVEDLFDLAEGFARQPLPAGPGLAILTNAGGPAIMATDACDALGVGLASLERETTEALRAALPEAAAVYNPVDVLGDAKADRYEAAARILAADPNVRSVVVILTPQAPTEARATAQAVAAVAKDAGLTVFGCFMGDRAVADGRAALSTAGVPSYEFPERAVKTLAAMERYREHLAAPVAEVEEVVADREAVRAIIEEARRAKRMTITEERAAAVATAYGIRVPAGGLAQDVKAARLLAARIGFPVAMKIASPDILHKSDLGGIRLNVTDLDMVTRAYSEIVEGARTRMPDALIWGVTVQQMVPAGREVIVGINRDPTFGPLVMFGLGGIYVEVMKDVTFRMCPVSPGEARAMVSGVKAFGLLRGARGEKPADIEAIVDTIVRVSALASDFDDILELDINPLMVMERGAGALAADIRIGIGG